MRSSTSLAELIDMLRSKCGPPETSCVRTSVCKCFPDKAQEAGQLKKALISSQVPHISAVEQRSLAAYLGGIIGDALGAPFEFMEYLR